MKYSSFFAKEDNTTPINNGSYVDDREAGTGTEVNYTDKSNSATFDEGTGKKDLIVMTGPLSEVYTKALGVYFAKKPIDGSVGEVEDVEGELFVDTTAAETMANDAMMAAAITEVAKSNDIDVTDVSRRVHLVSQFNDFDEEPDSRVVIIPANGSTAPTTIQHINHATNQAKATGKDLVVMVTTIEPNGGNGAEVVNRYIEPGMDDGLSAWNVGGDFNVSTDSVVTDPEDDRMVVAAIEKLCTPYQKRAICFGAEGLLKYLRKKYVG